MPHNTISLLASPCSTTLHFIHLRLLFYSFFAIIPIPSFIVTFSLCLSVVCLHLNICMLPRFPIITSHLQGPLLRRASHFRPHCDNRYLWHSLPGLLQSTPAPLYLFPLALTRFSPPISTTVPCLNVCNTFFTLSLFVHSPEYSI